MLATATILLMLAYVDAGANAEDVEPHDRTTVEGTIAAALDYLEKEDYLGLIENLAHPEELESMKKHASVEMIVKGLAEDRATKMVQALKLIKADKLVYNADRTEAVFEFPKPAEGPPEIKFAKYEGQWYIRDR